MNHFLLFAAWVAAGSAVPASRPVWERSELGATAFVAMNSAPYPHASRENGFKIADRTFPRDPHYVDNRVAIFIPNGWQPGERVDLLIYFHGHYNNIRKALEHFKLREQVTASGRNVILVFPEGPRDAGDSGAGKIEEPGGLRRLVDETFDVLVAEGRIPARRLGRVLLAGHSGAYRAMSFCVEHGGLEEAVTDVGLLDSSYARLDAFVDWAARRPTGRLFSIFTDHLAPENVYLMTHLKKRGATYELMDEQDATPATLVRNRILFLHASKLKHDDTVKWLQGWLAATSLAPTATRPAEDR